MIELENMEVCEKCSVVYMPQFEEDEWSHYREMCRVNPKYCERCEPLEVGGRK